MHIFSIFNNVFSFLNLFALLLWIICASGNENTEAPTIDLGYVKYAGYHNATSNINYYRSIPYAQAPLGELRWRKPQPIEGRNSFNEATFPATEPGPSCIQGAPPKPESFLVLAESFSANQSEDCLILDVLVPANPVSARLAVLVQVHGGDYTLGNAQYVPGNALVYASQGQIIYVSIQYRLGMFGFLAGSEISENGETNAGLLDQRAAIEWVQRNIVHFGGDPSKVTIWGGSAGGGSVSYQLIAGGAVDNPPFRAAIAEYPWWQPLMNASSQDIQYRTILDLANCTHLECLRSKSSEQLQLVSALSYNISFPSPGYGYGLFYYGPVVDRKFIRTLPSQEFQAGNFYKVPLLTDRDAYEGVAFTDLSLTSQTPETADAQNILPYAGPSFFSRLYKLYPCSAFNSTFYRRVAWFGELIISCPTYYMASAFTDHGTDSNASAAPVFEMIFAAGSRLHAATYPFLSSNEIGFPAAPNATLAEIMSSYWISFAVMSDPNPLRSQKAVFWPSYGAGGSGSVETGEVVGFSVLEVTDATLGVGTDGDVGARCDFFGSQGRVVSN